MDTYERILRLRVTRHFTDQPVDDETMARLLEAARWAGSSKNRQGWAFIVLTGDDLDRVADAGHFSVPLRHAAAGIALVRTPAGYDWDLGRAAQNIFLAADTLGLGACPITLHDDHLARQSLGIPPDHDCRYVIALGHPDHGAEAEARTANRSRGMSGRHHLDGLVHRHRWEG